MASRRLLGTAAAALLAAAVPAGARADDAEVAAAVSRARAVAGVPDPAAPQAPDRPVWVSVARGDSLDPGWKQLSFGTLVRRGSTADVYEALESDLPRLARYAHERWHRCGGFFAHDSLADAEQDLTLRSGAPAGSFAIDQEAVVRPLLPQVREPELRATISSLSALNNRYYQSDTGVAAAEWVRNRWQSLAPSASVRTVQHPGWRQPSVVATIQGQTDEIVVLGGHLDSISGWGDAGARAPGADDNASGIAVLTEALRVLSASGFRPKRTLEFMAYAAEEEGLRGSQEIARRYAREGRRVAAVIQFDMTNFKGSSGDLYLIQDNVDPGLSAFLGRLIDAYVGGKWGKIECGYACSDHASWTQNGFPAAGAFESEMEQMDPHIHSGEDTLANAGGDASHSVPFAKLAVAFAVEAAKSAGRAVLP